MVAGEIVVDRFVEIARQARASRVVRERGIVEDLEYLETAHLRQIAVVLDTAPQQIPGLSPVADGELAFHFRETLARIGLKVPDAESAEPEVLRSVAVGRSIGRDVDASETALTDFPQEHGYRIGCPGIAQIVVFEIRTIAPGIHPASFCLHRTILSRLGG